MSRVIFIPSEPVDNNHWVRNPDWLDLPVVIPGDNKMYGLLAVYSHLTNEVTVRFTTTGNVTVDWGDGITSSVPTLTDTTHTYNYGTILSPVLTDVGGYSYKMVIVEILFATTSNVCVTRTSPTEKNAPSKWLDIIIDNSNLTTFSPSEVRKALYMERMIVLNEALSGSMNTGWSYMTSLKVLDLDMSFSTGINTGLASTGDFRDSNGDPLDILVNSATNTSNAFQYSTVSQLGNISFTSSTTAFRMFLNNINLEAVGTINASGCPTIAGIFQECRNLRSIGTITTTAALTSINSAFRFCLKLENVTITNCSGVTDAGSAFIFCGGLKDVILTGLTRSVDLSSNDMDATAINALFTSLGIAAGVQTVTVTGNPGAATCNPLIATAKGWTVAV